MLIAIVKMTKTTESLQNERTHDAIPTFCVTGGQPQILDSGHFVVIWEKKS